MNLLDKVDTIESYNISNKDEKANKIFQKLEFGKIVIENFSFFEFKEIAEETDSYALKVIQLNSNERLTYIGKHLYKIKSDNPIYNYIDTGRKINTQSHYYSTSNQNGYFFNDMDISINELKAFHQYSDKEKLNLKLLGEFLDKKFYLVFKEDFARIYARIKILEVEQRQEKDVELTNEKEKERIKSCLENYKNLSIMEDENAIIQDNYIIDKKSELKIVFNDKIINLFDKNEIIDNYKYGYQQHNYIELDYNNAIQKIYNIYEISRYGKTLEQKISQCNSKLLNFKIYKYNPETKETNLLNSIKIKNTIKNKKYRYYINNIKMPKQKMKRAIEFLYMSRYGRIDNTEDIKIINRIKNYDTYLEKIKRYSGIQIDLLQGKTIELKYKNYTIPVLFEIENNSDDKNLWEVKMDNFKKEVEYSQIRACFYRGSYRYGSGISEQIANLCSALKSPQLEDLLIQKVHKGMEQYKKAEKKGKELFTEFLNKNKSRVIPKDNFFIVKGKLKNYKVGHKNNSNDIGVWTYPNENYVCINDNTKQGLYLCIWDKYLQYCLALLNDGNLREQIQTLQ